MTKLLKRGRMFAEPDDLDIVSTLTVGLATTISGNLMLAVCVHPILFADVNEVGHRLLPNLSRAAGDDTVAWDWAGAASPSTNVARPCEAKGSGCGEIRAVQLANVETSGDERFVDLHGHGERSPQLLGSASAGATQG